jgi:O-antigen/teichoic acid export membrane protein
VPTRPSRSCLTADAEVTFVRDLADRVLRGDEFRRGTITLVGGASIGQAIVVASSPFLTRLYQPAEFGAFSVAVAIMAVLITVACLRYEFAIPLPKRDLEAANVLGLSIVIALCTSVATGIVFVVVGPWFVTLVGASSLSPYVLLFAVGQFAGGVVSVFTMWAIRTRAYAEIAANRLTQSGTLVVVQVGLGLAGAGAPGLLVGAVAGNLGGSTRLGRAAWRTHGSYLRRISWSGMVAAARRYRRFPIFSSWSALINTLGEQVPLVVFVAVYGVAEGGEFALAQRVVALPVSLVAGAVGQAFFAEAARIKRQEPTALRGLFVGTTRKIAMLTIGPAILLAVLAPILAEPIFGDAWAEAGPFIAILTPMYCAQLIAASTGSSLDVLERQDLHLVREIMRLVVFGGAMLGAVVAGLAPTGFVIVLSAAGCLTYSIYLLISWRAILHHEHLLVARAQGGGPVPDVEGRREP